MLSRNISRLFATSSKKNIAVILSGCGVYDGSEIQEAVFVMESLSRRGARYQCFAPNMEQKHVINHLTGDPMDEKRNILIESARIARSNVIDIEKLDVSEYDGIVFPGGFGVAKNLSSFGSDGPKMTVIDSVSRLLKSFNETKKPIAACCIAPVMLARTFPKVHITLGQEQVCDDNPFADACGAAKVMGAIHEPCKATEVCIDKEMKIVTTPAYMRNSAIHIVRDDEIDEVDGKLVAHFGFQDIESEDYHSLSVKYVEVVKGIKVCLFHFVSKSHKRVVLYSHGNAIDIACCAISMDHLVSTLDTDYIFYDYEGYGCSDGYAHATNLGRDLLAVYEYARTIYPENAIYLAVGSVPTCAVASQLYQDYTMRKANGEDVKEPLGGVILHAALYSGASFPCGCLIHHNDPYNNAKQLKYVKCPVFHIHGTNDETVPFSLGSKLYNITKSKFDPWWVEGAGHLDIIMRHEKEYETRMLNFFEFCEKTSQEGQEGQEGQVEQVEKTEQVEQVEKIEQIEQTEQTEQTEQVEKIEKTEKIEQTEQVEKIEQTEQVEKIEKTEQTESIPSEDKNNQVQQVQQVQQVHGPEEIQEQVQQQNAQSQQEGSNLVADNVSQIQNKSEQ